MEGYDQKNCWKLELLKILLLYPSTKIGKTLMFFEQIKKFQCLKSSTGQGPQQGPQKTCDMCHMATSVS